MRFEVKKKILNHSEPIVTKGKIDDGPLKSVTLRIGEELHKPARVLMAEMDTSFQNVLEALLRGWVTGEFRISEREENPDHAYVTVHVPRKIEDRVRDVAEALSRHYRRAGETGIVEYITSMEDELDRRAGKTPTKRVRP